MESLWPRARSKAMQPQDLQLCACDYGDGMAIIGQTETPTHLDSKGIPSCFRPLLLNGCNLGKPAEEFRNPSLVLERVVDVVRPLETVAVEVARHLVAEGSGGSVVLLRGVNGNTRVTNASHQGQQPLTKTVPLAPRHLTRGKGEGSG